VVRYLFFISSEDETSINCFWRQDTTLIDGTLLTLCSLNIIYACV